MTQFCYLSVSAHHSYTEQDHTCPFYVTFLFFCEPRPKRKEARKATYAMHSAAWIQWVFDPGFGDQLIYCNPKPCSKQEKNVYNKNSRWAILMISWLQSVSVSNYQLSQSLIPQVPNSDEKRSFLCKKKQTNIANVHIRTVFRQNMWIYTHFV